MRRLALPLLVVVGVALGGIVASSGGSPGAATAGGCREHAGLPDHACTPGATDPRVTQHDIGRTICVPGYTSGVRPPSSYTTRLKRRQIREYHYYAGHRLAAYEEDHLVPLELGGAPRDAKNLWPEAHAPKPASYQKDAEENLLHARTCAHQMRLSVAQHEMAGDWLAAYRHDH